MSTVPPDIADVACGRLLAVGPDQQEAVLAELCRLHPDHEKGLRHLHAELRGTDRLLQDNLVTAPPDDDPKSIGAFNVLRRLGDGAFGVVYLCAQTAPIERHVAVKVLRPGAGSRQTLLRFEAERQVLARMNHPAIANVFDAGALPDGRPYFVMEYVDGAPITTFCDQRRLPVAERLALFLALCDGVQHAHQKGVIHRDLKPSNVLVCDQQGRVQPKIIDFGLAKVMRDPRTTNAELTEAGRVLGTPGFMSPEQGDGKHDDVDTRSDVFSLGVILYVLLTSEMPWRRGESTADTAPLRPSARLAGDNRQSTSIGAPRADEPHRVRSQVRGDLDWIAMRALERERDRRYQSVQELAEDLRRHQRHEPVLAGPPSTMYRLRKMARRYRMQCVAAAAVLVSLLLGLLGTWRYANRAYDNLQRFEILAIGSRLALARASASNLYPPWPERLTDFDRWLREHGDPLRAELPRLRTALAELRAQALPYTDADRDLDRQRHPVTAEIEKRRATIVYTEALLDHPSVQSDDREQVRQTLSGHRDKMRAELVALEPQQQERRTWRFVNGSQQFLHDTMVGLADDLTQFCAAESCVTEVIAAQRDEIVTEMANAEQRRELWQRTLEAIASDPRFAGLRLQPQVGLVPLGPDPESGLQEFYHLRSGPVGGAVPARGADGRLDLDLKAGIVFVLIPGGRSLHGAQSNDPTAPGYDPDAKADSPVHALALAPFFLGKHEVTQSQWWYLTDTLPSHFHKSTVTRPGHEITLRHPVENVTWQDGQRGLRKQGLELPTEAQWEYACRAGSTTIWPTGDTPDTLAQFAHVGNVDDRDGGADANQAANDRFHAEVGSLLANAFGLHDMVGNVAEWCRDHFSSLAYLLTPRPGDGLRPVPEVQMRVVRGGTFEDRAYEGASAARHPMSHSTRARYLGVRAARRVQGLEPDGK